MKKLCHLSNNILIVSISLIVFFPTGAFSHCGNNFHAHVHTVKEIDALIGSCVDISCRFENFEGFDSNRITFGIWMKNKAEVSDTVYNSSGKINTYQMETTGNLRKQNCSIRIPNLTAAHADNYFFRLENGPVKVTFCDDPFKLTVRDSAWSPIINVSGSELKEHQSVTVTCSAHTPCSLSPPILSWNIEGDSVRKIEKITDGAFTTKFQETITLYDTHNGYSIKCSAKYPVTGGFKQAVAEKTLNVSYVPAGTAASISPSSLVSQGATMELRCNSRGNPPITSYAWFKNSGRGDSKVSSAQTFSFNATERAAFICEATNRLGSHKSKSICVDIKDAPFTPSIHISTHNPKERRRVTITCSAFTPCPQSTPKLTWNLQQDSLTQTSDNTEGTFTTKIQKTFTLTYKHDGFIIRCFSKHPAIEKDNVVQTEMTLSVSYAPKDTSASISPSDEESDDGWVELSCSSRAKPPPSFTWFKKGPQISTQVATGIFHKVQFTQGGQYFCVAANTLGSQKSSPVSVRTKGLPGLWMYIVIAILGIGLLRSTHFMIKKWIQASSSSQAH